MKRSLLPGTLFFLAAALAGAAAAQDAAPRAGGSARPDTVVVSAPGPSLELLSPGTYRAGEIVVSSERPGRFAAFGPSPSLVRGLSGRGLRWAPRVSLADYGTSAFPAVRGLPIEHVLVEYDGVPLNSVQNGTFDLALLSPLAANADIARGPFAWANSGRPGQARLSIEASSSTGADAAVRVGSSGSTLAAGGGGESLALRFGASSLSGERAHSDLAGWAAELSGRSSFADGALTFASVGRGIPGPVDAPAFAGDEDDELAIARVRLTGVRGLRPVFYAVHGVERYADSTSSPTHRSTSVGGVLTFARTEPGGGPAASLSYDWSLVESHDSIGPDLGRHERGSTMAGVSYVAGSGALRISGRSALTYLTDLGFTPSGAVGVAGLWPGARVWASAGTTSRPPTMNELYWPVTVWSSGNPGLDSERVSTLETGCELRRGGLAVGMTAYASRAAGLIVWGDEGGVWRPENVARAVLRGAELDATLRAGMFDLAYALTLGRATDAETGLALPYRPDVEQWGALGATVSAGRVEGIVRSASAVKVDGGAATLGGYTVVDCRADIDLPAPGLRLIVELDNLLDARYATRAGYELPGFEWSLGLAFEARASAAGPSPPRRS